MKCLTVYKLFAIALLCLSTLKNRNLAESKPLAEASDEEAPDEEAPLQRAPQTWNEVAFNPNNFIYYPKWRYSSSSVDNYEPLLCDREYETYLDTKDQSWKLIDATMKAEISKLDVVFKQTPYWRKTFLTYQWNFNGELILRDVKGWYWQNRDQFGMQSLNATDRDAFTKYMSISLDEFNNREKSDGIEVDLRKLVLKTDFGNFTIDPNAVNAVNQTVVNESTKKVNSNTKQRKALIQNIQVIILNSPKIML